MARLFNGSGSDTGLATSVTGVDFTNAATQGLSMACWFKWTATNTAQNMFLHPEGTGSGNQQGGIQLGSGTPNPFTYGFYNGSVFAGAQFTTAPTVGVWTAGVGTWDGATYRAYTTGLTSVSSANTVGPNYPISTIALAYQQDNNANYFNGALAELAIWNCTLSALEANAFLAGVRAWRIRRAALCFYAPLDGLQSTEPDLSGKRNNVPINGTTTVFGPPFTTITRPWPQTLYVPPPLTQTHFRFRTDTGAVDGTPTWGAPEDTL